MRLSANSNLIFENNYSRILLIHIKPENVININNIINVHKEYDSNNNFNKINLDEQVQVKKIINLFL